MSSQKATRETHNTPFSFTPYEIKEGEEYMNEDQVEHFRRILQSW